MKMTQRAPPGQQPWAWATDSELTIERTAFESNEADNRGGGLYLAAGAGSQTTITDSVITGNSAGSGAGGILAASGGLPLRTSDKLLAVAA